MQQLTVNLKNCYGINQLNCDFYFNRKNGCVIYASNGTMKTSFANTFLAISENREPEDRVRRKDPICNIKKKESESSPLVDIESDDIFVIESYNDESYRDSIKFDNISFLLVKDDLKKDYDKIYQDINLAKKKLFDKIKTSSGVNIKKIEEIFLKDFDESDGNFLEILSSLENEIDGTQIIFPDIKYQTLFNDKALAFIEKEDVMELIKNYATKYSELIDNSEIFEKNVFNHNNAASIGKQLKTNGFFDADHKISLKDRKELVNSQEELEEIIKAEKDRILSEKDLTEFFDQIDSELNRNKELRDLRTAIDNHPELITELELENISEFKKKIWVSILNIESKLYSDLIKTYRSGKKDIERIIDEAKSEKKEWKDVVELFNKRFIVPFELEVSNQEDVILKRESPVVKFRFKDNDPDEVYIKNDDLINVLSNGEKRALYLLNIIYEIEIRKKTRQKTLIIADDIVDSFDYQNKYAIVEYLNDILKEDIFKIIILTHNFDFYRTIGSRLDITSNSYLALREGDIISIRRGGKFHENIFQTWKREFDNGNINKRVFIASIPFIRNLIEYIYGNRKDCYMLLTKLLHLKDDTKSLRMSDLKDVYQDVWNLELNCEPDYCIYDLIMEEGKKIASGSGEALKLENKIALSIAIRLLAEDLMINKITDKEKIDNIKGYQTRELFNEFKKEYTDDPLVKSLEQVNLMTPENIHINSFMYEPILDMSDNHLRTLYTEIEEANDARDST